MFLVKSCIILCYYILGAYATTDIIRLSGGAVLSVSDPDCYCPICHKKIPLRYQFPIISYIFSHGRCHNCHSKIPFFDLFFELFILISATIVTLVTKFTSISYILVIVFYEVTKLLFVLYHKPREKDFIKNVVLSLVQNLIFFILLGLLFCMLNILRLQSP